MDARFVAKTLWPDEEEAFFAEVAAAAAAAEAEKAGEKEATVKRRSNSESLLMLPLLLLLLLLLSSSLPPPQQQRPRRADIVLRRVPPGGAKLAAEQEAQQRLERARLGSGFALFLEALRDSGLPVRCPQRRQRPRARRRELRGRPAAAPLAGGFRRERLSLVPRGVVDTKVLASKAFSGRDDPLGAPRR